jgi:hypothetical protein
MCRPERAQEVHSGQGEKLAKGACMRSSEKEDEQTVRR